ncbi:hypothetical protein RND81_06G060200 [Saponaria officinalis]|uniref:Secreted protein n=1 Tax=Saponaria officinalis TaxID=3572 RepID=A0AAW1K6J8_SAPOF
MDRGNIPFSAFWLRSSVVSVLISLISDMWGVAHLVACCLGHHPSPKRYTTAWARRTSPKINIREIFHGTPEI